MESLDDRELLSLYAASGAEPAFTELVRRYLDILYASALRQVRDPAAAADVTQAVFIALAQKAPRLAPNTPLINWLMTVVRCAARESLRRRARRDHHERKAVAMKSRTHLPPEPAEDFALLIPHLDAALARLPSADRSAILLRYFQQKPLREVSLALHTSDDAARKRIARALDKLRQLFARQGIALSVAAVAAALASAAAAQAAPPVLAPTVTAVALAAAKGTLTTGAALTLARGALHMLTRVKVTLTAFLAAATVAASAVVVVHQALAQTPAPGSASPAATPTAAAPAADAPTALPALANPMKVFPSSPPAYQDVPNYHLFTMRLSPDGQHILYSRPTDRRDPARSPPEIVRELVLRELATGKETVLLQGPGRPNALNFDIFDAASRRLLLAQEALPPRTLKPAIYDLAQAKASDLDVEASSFTLPRFTADGQGLLFAADEQMLASVVDPQGVRVQNITVTKWKRLSLTVPDAQPQTLSAPGMPWSLMGVSPTGDLAVFYTAAGSRNLGPDVVESLLVWDLKADEEVTELPSHDGELGDTQPPWTPNGRYLYYLVEDPGREGPAAAPAGNHGSRIWDRQTGEIVGTVPNTYPVGPGPGDSLMVLEQRKAGQPRSFILHDAATGKQYPLGDGSKKLIHAAGGKILYAEKPDQAADEAVFVADLVMPNAGK